MSVEGWIGDFQEFVSVRNSFDDDRYWNGNFKLNDFFDSFEEFILTRVFLSSNTLSRRK